VSDHLLLVFLNPVEGREDDFNAFYESTHLPQILAVDGVRSAQRLRIRPSDPGEGSPHRYLTIYELDGADPDATLQALYDANVSGAIEPFEAMDPNVKPVVYEVMGDRRTK
jgi:hypothetical protein